MTDGLRAAEAFRHKDYIEINGCVDIGVYLMDPERETYFLAPDCSDIELGEALQKALAAYRVLSPASEEARSLTKRAIAGEFIEKWEAERMEKFGYKRKSQLYKRIHNCSIRSVEGIITIKPSNHDHPRGWSAVDRAYDVHIPDTSTPEEIGAALRLGFSRCWGKY